MAPMTNPTRNDQKQREDFRLQLISDNPQTEPYFIDLLLDVYEKNPGFVETLVKKHKQGSAPTQNTLQALIQKSISVLPVVSSSGQNRKPTPSS